MPMKAAYFISLFTSRFIRVLLAIMVRSSSLALFRLNGARNAGIFSGPTGCEFKDGFRQLRREWPREAK